MRQKPLVAIGAVAIVTTVLRAVWILRLPDIDMDAYGHFGIGRGLCLHPTNIAAHWVWLPLYHYLIAGLTCLGGTFLELRLFSDLAIGALPLLVYAYERKRETAVFAAVFVALAAVPNELGVSAQQEALFCLLIFLTVSAIDAGRAWSAGLLLMAACLIRYEAWGACALVLAQPIAARVFRLRPIPWRVGILPLVGIGAWIGVHRWADGKWFFFLEELYRYTHMQRGVYDRGAVIEAIWFPLVVPLIAFGPAILCAPMGIRSAFRRGWIVPFGIYLFLLASYLGKGALGGHRYYGSLVPFFCIAMAHAATRYPRWRSKLLGVIVLSLVVTTTIGLGRIGRIAANNVQAFHDAEESTRPVH